MQSNGGCTVAQKTHHLPSEELLGEDWPYDPIDRIVIIRNPYKAILSFRNYVDSGEYQLGHGSENSFKGSGTGTRKKIGNSIKVFYDSI